MFDDVEVLHACGIRPEQTELSHRYDLESKGTSKEQLKRQRRNGLVGMANQGTPENLTIEMLEQKLKRYEVNLKEIYAEIAAAALPTPEQIQNWDHLKEINRIHIEQTRQQIKELE